MGWRALRDSVSDIERGIDRVFDLVLVTDMGGLLAYPPVQCRLCYSDGLGRHIRAILSTIFHMRTGYPLSMQPIRHRLKEGNAASRSQRNQGWLFLRFRFLRL